MYIHVALLLFSKSVVKLKTKNPIKLTVSFRSLSHFLLSILHTSLEGVGLQGIEFLSGNCDKN